MNDSFPGDQPRDHGRASPRPDSIEKNAAALYRKLGVRNRTEAARRAAELLGVTPGVAASTTRR
jgi:hypothetical protein